MKADLLEKARKFNAARKRVKGLVAGADLPATSLIGDRDRNADGDEDRGYCQDSSDPSGQGLERQQQIFLNDYNSDRAVGIGRSEAARPRSPCSSPSRSPGVDANKRPMSVEAKSAQFSPTNSYRLHSPVVHKVVIDSESSHNVSVAKHLNSAIDDTYSGDTSTNITTSTIGQLNPAIQYSDYAESQNIAKEPPLSSRSSGIGDSSARRGNLSSRTSGSNNSSGGGSRINEGKINMNKLDFLMRQEFWLKEHNEKVESLRKDLESKQESEMVFVPDTSAAQLSWLKLKHEEAAKGRAGITGNTLGDMNHRVYYSARSDKSFGNDSALTPSDSVQGYLDGAEVHRSGGSRNFSPSTSARGANSYCNSTSMMGNARMGSAEKRINKSPFKFNSDTQKLRLGSDLSEESYSDLNIDNIDNLLEKSVNSKQHMDLNNSNSNNKSINNETIISSPTRAPVPKLKFSDLPRSEGGSLERSFDDLRSNILANTTSQSTKAGGTSSRSILDSGSAWNDALDELFLERSSNIIPKADDNRDRTLPVPALERCVNTSSTSSLNSNSSSVFKNLVDVNMVETDIRMLLNTPPPKQKDNKLGAYYGSGNRAGSSNSSDINYITTGGYSTGKATTPTGSSGRSSSPQIKAAPSGGVGMTKSHEKASSASIISKAASVNLTSPYLSPPFALHPASARSSPMDSSSVSGGKEIRSVSASASASRQKMQLKVGEQGTTSVVGNISSGSDSIISNINHMNSNYSSSSSAYNFERTPPRSRTADAVNREEEDVRQWFRNEMDERRVRAMGLSSPAAASATAQMPAATVVHIKKTQGLGPDNNDSLARSKNLLATISYVEKRQNSRSDNGVETKVADVAAIEASTSMYVSESDEEESSDKNRFRSCIVGKESSNKTDDAFDITSNDRNQVTTGIIDSKTSYDNRVSNSKGFETNLEINRIKSGINMDVYLPTKYDKNYSTAPVSSGNFSSAPDSYEKYLHTLLPQAAPTYLHARSSLGSMSSPSSSTHSVNSGVGSLGFFDPSSTVDKGRHRVNDARHFITESMFRKKDPRHGGVTILFGTKRSNADVAADLGSGGSSSSNSSGYNKSGSLGGKEKVVTVLFDRNDFTEDSAYNWWCENKATDGIQDEEKCTL